MRTVKLQQVRYYRNTHLVVYSNCILKAWIVSVCLQDLSPFELFSPVEEVTVGDVYFPDFSVDLFNKPDHARVKVADPVHLQVCVLDHSVGNFDIKKIYHAGGNAFSLEIGDYAEDHPEGPGAYFQDLQFIHKP